MITLALAIPHTSWRLERIDSCKRLLGELGLASLYDCLLERKATTYEDANPKIATRIFGERAANAVWSERMWVWGVDSGMSHFVQLQDDVRVSPRFWGELVAMLEAVPDEVIGLEVVHPAAPALAEEGNRWFTTSDGLVGVGYVMPTPLLDEFLLWREAALARGALEALTEDTLIGLWCASIGRRVWHPLPTILDHDTSLPSTYGNDAHAHRRPRVRWDTDRRESLFERTDPAFWAPVPREKIPHLGRFYDATPALCARWVEGFTPADRVRLQRDDGAAMIRALGRRRRARLEPPTARLVVATPTRGDVAPQYASAIANLVAAPDLEVDAARFDLERLQLRNADVVRARSVMVRSFLEETDATHLLFVDADVSFDPELVRGMLRVAQDVVAAPYPSRDGVNFERAARAQAPLWEAAAYRYALHLEDDALNVQPDGTAPIAGIGLGCALLSRGCLEAMTAHYRSTLTFADRSGHGGAVPTVALFAHLFERGELYSEDFSFCTRWRRMGGVVHLYLGPGAPATHHGPHAFRGRIEAFGLRRQEA